MTDLTELIYIDESNKLAFKDDKRLRKYRKLAFKQRLRQLTRKFTKDIINLIKETT